MEKPHSSLKGKILKFIPRAASASVTFKSPPISPKPPAGPAGRPVPGGSIIPKDARRRIKNGSFDSRDPGSPVVSCVGQVKKKKKGTSSATRAASIATARPDTRPKKKVDAPSMGILKLFKAKNKNNTTGGGRGGGGGGNEKPVPSLGHLKQFASSRGVLANFDWVAQCGTAVAPDNFIEEESIRANEKVEKTIMIPHSAPIEVGISGINGVGLIDNLQPRKEINLWKRRTMVRPPPLRL